MRRLIVLAALIVTIVLSGTSTGAQEPIRVGVIFSLSGPVAPLGQFGKAGLDLALEEVNAAGGGNGRPLELIGLHDESKPAPAHDLPPPPINRGHLLRLHRGRLRSTP